MRRSFICGSSSANRKRLRIFLVCALAVLATTGSFLLAPAHAEGTAYLYDATGHGWTCLRSNEQMNIDKNAGAYPDGTAVRVLEKKEDGSFSLPRYKVKIGRFSGWVFADELLNENVWLQKKASGQYVPFENQWLIDEDVDEGYAPLYTGENPSTTSYNPESYRQVNESPFIALGIYQVDVHALLSDDDGLINFFNTISDTKYMQNSTNTYWDYEFPIWINTLQRAVVKTKGTDKANWTEIERKVLEPLEPNYTRPEEREIQPSDGDIGLEEAQAKVLHALRDAGYVTNQNAAQFEYGDHYLYYDYKDTNKHIWHIQYSNERWCRQNYPDSDDLPKSNPPLYFSVELDARTGEVIYMTIYPE